MKTMKNLFIAMAFMFSSSTLFSQTPYKMKVNDQLIYRVEAGSMEYDFIVVPKKLSATEISFEYRMGEPVNRSGSVSMNAEALKSAMAMFNRFSSGAVNLTDETSVFASNAMVTAAKEGSGTFYLMGKSGPATEFTTLAGMDSPTNGSTYMKLVKNVGGVDYSLNGPIMENADGSKGIRIANEGDYPFITYMNIDFKVYLTKIVR